MNTIVNNNNIIIAIYMHKIEDVINCFFGFMI